MKEAEAAQAAKGKGKSKALQVLNGRALFNFNKDLFQDDENAAAADAYEEVEGEEEEVKKADEKDVPEESKVDEALFAAEAGDLEEDVDFD